MKTRKALQYHQKYQYTYFITITTNYRYYNTKPIFKKFKNYLYWHDRNSHIVSVKEITTISKGLHYHVLYFTDKKLDYSKVHKKMPKHGTIDIQLVLKTDEDIKNVLRYMNKTKKCHKSDSKIMSINSDSQVSKCEIKTSSEVKPKRLSIFDFNPHCMQKSKTGNILSR